VVSSKVHRRAVRRNRLRRLLHEELRQRPPEPRQAQWLLFSLLPGSAEADEARLLGECRQLLLQAGLRP
jgi:ribonuclease P protein component